MPDDEGPRGSVRKVCTRTAHHQIAWAVFSSRYQSMPSKHAYVGPTLAQRLQLRWINVARQRWINVVLLIGPTVALPLAPTICQPSANVDPTLAQRNSIWNYVGSTLIQRNLVHHYVGPSLDQRWSNVMQYVITLGHHWANADPT